ncbi:MAG: YchF-related putative GTPase [Nanopusillaceae archaeon]
MCETWGVVVVIGIIGKPNVGKSTFFRSVTLLPVKTANYPFTTVQPYIGTGYLVIDCIESYFKVKCNPRSGTCKRGKRYIPIEIIDIPGLVEEAYRGKGLGNKFLDITRNVDVLINIIDIAGTTDMNGRPVPEGSYNPMRDFIWVENEIDTWFFYKIKNNVAKIYEKYMKNEKKLKEKIIYLFLSFKIKKETLIYVLEKFNKSIEEIIKDDELLFNFCREVRKIGKPIVYAANKIDLDYGKRYYKKALEEYSDKIIIPTSAYVELGLKIMDMEGKIEYVPGEEIELKINDPQVEVFVEYAKHSVIDEFGSTGVQEALNAAIFNALGYIAVWPVATEDLKDTKGRILPDIVLLPPGSKVKDLAMKLHTDLYKKMVLAKELKSGKILKKEDLLEHNDVINIITKK